MGTRELESAPDEQIQALRRRHAKPLVRVGAVALLAVGMLVAGCNDDKKSGSGTDSVSPKASSSAPAPSATSSQPASGGESSSGSPTTSNPQTSKSSKAALDADGFKAWTASSSLPSNVKSAVSHVTHVSAQSGFASTVDITTDLTGGITSTSDTGTAKLIVTAAVDWANSQVKADSIGLVTVYNSSGNILSNGTFGSQ